MRVISTEVELAQAVNELTNADPRLRSIVAAHGLPPLRRAAPGIECLLRIVTDQLISLKAGAAIWKRVNEKLQPLDPITILQLGEMELRELGLSGAKARTFLAVAQAAQSGLFEELHSDLASDEAILGRLKLVAGIGQWTADVYLLTAIGRADAWPAGDLALQVAVADLLQLPRRPNQCEMNSIAEAWRPWRSVAARILWCHYRGLKALPQLI